MGWKAKNIEKLLVHVAFIFAHVGGLEEVSEHLRGCLGRCWLGLCFFGCFLDVFGCFRMFSDVFGRFQTFSDVFGRFRPRST